MKPAVRTNGRPPMYLQVIRRKGLMPLSLKLIGRIDPIPISVIINISTPMILKLLYS
jgi:hypothetical protein